jgi:hypothetical protein
VNLEGGLDFLSVRLNDFQVWGVVLIKDVCSAVKGKNVGNAAKARVRVCEGLPGVYSTIWCLCYKPAVAVLDFDTVDVVDLTGADDVSEPKDSGTEAIQNFRVRMNTNEHACRPNQVNRYCTCVRDIKGDTLVTGEEEVLALKTSMDVETEE